MDINIIIERPDFKIAIEKILLEKLKSILTEIEITISIDDKKKEIEKKLVYDSSFIKIIINENFVINHFIKQTLDYKNIKDELLSFFNLFSKSSDEINGKYNSFSAFSLIYNYKDIPLHFPFNFSSQNYSIAFEGVLDLLTDIIKDEKSIVKTSINKTFVEGNGERVFLYENEKWKIIDPLNTISKSLNEKYRKNKDYRIKKPHIIINRDCIWKYFVFDTNWVLVFDNLETMMMQPNDVAIYSSIADKNLKFAELFYNDNILPRHKKHFGSFPLDETQKKYFHYFELIIQAIIFSYTSIEAFANICIPYNYEYITEKDGIKTIYSKEAIERKFTLKDKLKNHLKDILETPDITKTIWWDKFIKLEEIRNEIIHTKPSKSEDRYSKLLEHKVFEIIKVHKTIIEYFGKYINENHKVLLDEFPYNFGFDEVYPATMSGKAYDKSYRNMNNITQ
jgi:hypothetical protein